MRSFPGGPGHIAFGAVRTVDPAAPCGLFWKTIIAGGAYLLARPSPFYD